jgi:hypothetical protein
MRMKLNLMVDVGGKEEAKINVTGQKCVLIIHRPYCLAYL